MWPQIIRTVLMTLASETTRQAVRKIMNPQNKDRKKPVSYYKGK